MIEARKKADVLYPPFFISADGIPPLDLFSVTNRQGKKDSHQCKESQVQESQDSCLYR
jgi:hypothetical protein